MKRKKNGSRDVSLRFFVSRRPNDDRNEYPPRTRTKHELLTNTTFVNSARGTLHTFRNPC